jgi:hypothetical protein
MHLNTTNITMLGHAMGRITALGRQRGLLSPAAVPVDDDDGRPRLIARIGSL